MLCRVLVLPLVLLAFSAQAQQQPPGETLLLTPPPGWQPVQVQRTEKVAITRLFPPGQADKGWTEVITVQIQRGADITPREHMDSVMGHSRDSCEAAGSGPVTEGMVNGYPMAQVAVSCTRGLQSGMGGFVVAQAIRGKDALYVVQRQWRGATFDKDDKPPVQSGMLQEWAGFMKSVGLCDSRSPRHPCPN